MSGSKCKVKHPGKNNFIFAYGMTGFKLTIIIQDSNFRITRYNQKKISSYSKAVKKSQ